MCSRIFYLDFPIDPSNLYFYINGNSLQPTFTCRPIRVQRLIHGVMRNWSIFDCSVDNKYRYFYLSGPISWSYVRVNLWLPVCIRLMQTNPAVYTSTTRFKVTNQPPNVLFDIILEGNLNRRICLWNVKNSVGSVKENSFLFFYDFSIIILFHCESFNQRSNSQIFKFYWI